MAIPVDHVQKLEDDNNRLRNEAAAQAKTLAQYKDAVKSLSFDLEMARTSYDTAKIVDALSAARKAALEQAADLLMDHGVVVSGHELVDVCEQIKALATKPPRTDFPWSQKPKGGKDAELPSWLR